MTRVSVESCCEKIVLDLLDEDEYWLWEIKSVFDCEPACKGSSKEQTLSKLIKANLIRIGRRKPLDSTGEILSEKDALRVLQSPNSWVATEADDEIELYFADLANR